MTEFPIYSHTRYDVIFQEDGELHLTCSDVSNHDFVEVVRCNNCREYDITGYDDTPGFGWCRCLRRDVQDCFYCAHGEKGANE